MSRLIVKSLPPNCTEASLRKFYKKYGTLTDVALKYTKEGKFRKFAFIGFDDEPTAQKALAETHQAYMGSSRLQVQECRSFGDSNKPRAWSQYSKDSSAYKRKHGEDEPSGTKTDAAEPTNKKKKADPEYTKFLEAKGVDTKVEPDLAVPEPTVEDAKLIEELMEGIAGDTQHSLTFTGLPSAIKPKSLKDWLAPIRVKAMKLVRNDSSGAAFVTFNRPPDVRRALTRDQEFIGGYKVTIKAIEEEKPVEEVEEKQYGMKERDPEAIANEEAKVREDILETGRLFVRNLPFVTKEEDLQFLFKKYGEISDVQVIINKTTNQCKGYAIVEFMFPESAVAAYAAQDGKIFKGRVLHILAGSEKKDSDSKEKETEEGEEGEEKKPKKEEKSSFKKEKMAKLKANAGKSHSWNALFLGPNAIADTLAAKLGVGKSDLLLGESGESAGVRLALAETRLVRETKDFLVANGVQLDAFSRPAAKRSDMVMLAKNLPAGVEPEELKRMFERHGDVKNVLMPPEGGVSALIVMGNRADAKKAFQALAYSRFRTLPLYLEWAPGDVFGEMPKDETEEVAKVEEEEDVPAGATVIGDRPKTKRELKYEMKLAEKRRKKEEAEAIKKEEPAEETEEVVENTEASAEGEEETTAGGEDDGIESGSTVFVKNLAFDTTDESLTEMFSKKFRIKNAQISKKLNPADPSKNLSMGFGFVQFYTKEAAEHAVKTLQGELLDGHCLELKISHREVVDKDSLKKKGVNAKLQGQCTKLMVRNLPFQAQIKEIENLFATFGEIRSIRIPKKVGSRDQHRGFGFVDFLSVGEAKRAFEALVHSTHLYGRRLVLEWANEDETVEELREKTADKFSGEKASKKMKKRMEAIENDLTKIVDED